MRAITIGKLYMRDELGVVRLPSNGLAVTNETYVLCEAEVKNKFCWILTLSA
ncbi:MAG: hypothetical protein ACI9LM_003304 [Alteromonadaceae bacterium]|jgi:hypothetical protein